MSYQEIDLHKDWVYQILKGEGIVMVFDRDEVIRCCHEAIDLFLEFRDVHGYGEEDAKTKAMNEMCEGLDVQIDMTKHPEHYQPEKE